MKVGICKTSKNIPEYSTRHAAGVDLVATSMKKEGTWLFPIYTYGTDVKVEIPNGYFGLLTPRSSISKKRLMLANSVGIIDADYRGEIMLKFRGLLWFKPYKVGDRVGQLILMRKGLIEFFSTDLSETERGEGGFGSTGE